MSRPEHETAPDIYYDAKEADKYTQNSRIIEIQSLMSERAIELLNLPPIDTAGPQLILDIGCGSGLSGDVLTSAGHHWVGVDISEAMLGVAVKRQVAGDMFLADIGDGLFFRPGMFDGAVSISAIQWLCYAFKNYHDPWKRFNNFFQSLYNCLQRGARAVFQFYPENAKQMEMITAAAMKCGFTGGLVVDYPNSTKAKKYFLCLFAGNPPDGYKEHEGMEDEDGKQEADGEDRAQFESSRDTKKKRKGKFNVDLKHRDWIVKKKESRRKKGLEVRPDTKYTGRKRNKPRF